MRKRNKTVPLRQVAAARFRGQSRPSASSIPHLRPRQRGPRSRRGQSAQCAKSSGDRRFRRQDTLSEDVLKVEIWIGFVNIKSVTAVTLVSILPKKNVARELDSRQNDLRVPLEWQAAAAYAPARHPGPLGLHAAPTRLGYGSPRRFGPLRPVHPPPDRQRAIPKALSVGQKRPSPAPVGV